MNATETAVSVVKTAKDRNISFLAAGFAYYAFVSLIPLVLLALVVGSLLGGERTAEQLVLFAGDFLPEAGEELVTAALLTESGRREATVVALVVSTWGGLKVFRGLSLAFDTVYDAAAEDSLLVQIRDGIAVILATVGALALMIVIGTVLSLVADAIPVSGAVGWIVLLLGLFLVFIPMYYVLPPVTVDLVETVPGAAFAAVGWTVLQIGFQLYAANAGQYEAYGAVGVVILFVTWLYFAGILLLFGAVLNVVLFRPQAAA